MQETPPQRIEISFSTCTIHHDLNVNLEFCKNVVLQDEIFDVCAWWPGNPEKTIIIVIP